MIVLYDDARARVFEPFATSRPLGEVRAGALLGRERWARWFGARVDGAVVAEHLSDFGEFDAPPVQQDDLAAGTWVVNTRALPVLPQAGALGHADVVRIASRVAAVRLHTACALSALADGALVLETLVPSSPRVLDVDGIWLEDPWDIIRHLTSQLTSDLAALGTDDGVFAVVGVGGTTGPVIVGDGGVFVEPGVTLEPFTLFDTTAGPILVRRGSTVQAFTRIVGPCYIGRDCNVVGDRIAASSIGDTCRVHGELSMSVFIGHANKGHDGFVGHSILGRWVNLGAGTITSNLKNTYGTVAMWTTDGIRDTGLQFAGTFFGDHAKTGIGLRLTTGCVIGAGANVMDAMPPKAVAPFAWGARAPYATFDDVKFLETAERVMARRGTVLDERQRAHLGRVKAHAERDVRWPR